MIRELPVSNGSNTLLGGSHNNVGFRQTVIPPVGVGYEGVCRLSASRSLSGQAVRGGKRNVGNREAIAESSRSQLSDS